MIFFVVFVFPRLPKIGYYFQMGVELIELGRKQAKLDPIPAEVRVVEEVAARTQEVRKVLLAMEHGDKYGS